MTALEAGNHNTSDLLEGISPIDLPAVLLVAGQAFLSLMADGLNNVVKQNLGLHFLLNQFGQFKAEALQMLAMFDQLKTFLDAPAFAIKLAKICGGIGCDV